VLDFNPESSDSLAMVSSDSLHTDVLIIGGGLVGAAQAIAMASAGLSVCVVDRMDPAKGRGSGFDGRASAIALATQRVLSGIGVWQHLGDDPAPILDIRVSDGPSLLFLHYDHSDIGDDPFGYMVENRHMRRALMQRVDDFKTISFLAPNGVKSLNRDASRVTAELNDGRRVTARLCVGAEGRHSPTRDSAGIKITSWPYNQTAIVCSVEHEISHDFVAHEHFLPAGPFAILPLNGDGNPAGNMSSIVWTEKSELAPHILDLDDLAFKSEFDTRFGDFLGSTRIVGPRFSYPLSLQFAHSSTDLRLALVGDASHGMHPIAGQGLNMGLRDVAVLAEVVADAKRLGMDIGGGDVLQRYEQWRRFDNTLMLAATDGLNRLFSNDIPPVRLARDLGLAVVNGIPPLRKTFMRHAMGLVGELPRLMRGEAL
jgi:2-octaprenyl-6-methoxyphenol hydroxylase